MMVVVVDTEILNVYDGFERVRVEIGKKLG